MSLGLIEAGSAEPSEIQPSSVRAVCHRLSVRGAIPNSAKGSPDRVSRALTCARGPVPSGWIMDAGGAAESLVSSDELSDYTEAVTRFNRRNRRDMRPLDVELWSE